MRESSGIARTRRSDAVAAYVRDAILARRLRAGDYVRPEAVAEEVGVSATPAREGLMLLRDEGLLVHELRRGFRVVSLSVQDVTDTFVAQAMLAGELAARAAATVTPERLERLTAVQDDLERARDAGDSMAMERLNHEFHRTLYATVDAPKLKWLLRLTLQAVPRRFYGSIDGWPRATVEDHRTILSALSAAEPEAVRAAMEAHIRAAGDLLAGHLAQNQEETI